MFYYSLKGISQNDFSTHKFILRHSRRNLEKKIKVKVDGKKNNFQETLDLLDKIFPGIYQKVSSKSPENKDYLMNNNRGNFLAWYIDGSKEFTRKGNLQYNSEYVITEKDYEDEELFISKPDHDYIGSGKYIKFGTYKEMMEREKIKFNGEYVNFIIQPLISKKLRFWEEYRKFDVRLYAAIYNIGDSFEYYAHPYGVARVALNKYDPTRDYSSVITNIAVQEVLPEYTKAATLKLVKDDLNIGKKVLSDLKKRDFLRRDKRKKNQLLILGLDVLILNDGDFRLIEINEDPYLVGKEDPDDMEKVACLTFVMKIFGNIIPDMKSV